jgi:hypothetical protein
MNRLWFQITSFRLCCIGNEQFLRGDDDRNAFLPITEKDDGFSDLSYGDDVETDEITELDNVYKLPGDNARHESNQNDGALEHCLPDTSKWTHRPIFIQPIGDTKCPDHDIEKSLPVGVPIEFESDLFKGKILFRFRDGPSDNQHRCDDYFQGANYNIKRQVIFQGKFKSSIKWSEGMFFL